MTGEVNTSMKRKRTRPAGEQPAAPADPAHAPGKRRLGPPAQQAQEHHETPAKRMHDQPWLPTSGRVGRRRRSARRG
jgi:hypothetical protein